MLLLWFACLKVRPYALYIGKDQTSASTKVEAVGKLMMSDQVRAAYPQTAQMYVAETGVKRDWRRSRVRNADGFTLDALGMDVALLRGIKVDFSRPGVIILDDIEDFVDTKYMTKKRIDVLTRSIIPAAATDVVYIFVQNKIHSDSIMARLLDDRADFFGDRLVLGPYPQIEGLVTEEYRDDKDRLRHRITAGRPTWPAVLGIEVSNRQLTDEGLVAFLSEKQHETDAAEGDIFPKEHWQYRSADQLPKKLRLVRAWDLAGTEGGGDYTVGILMACDHQTGDYWILDVVRGQWAVSDVHRVVQEISEADRDRWAHGKSRYRVAIESQPGAAGKAWNDQWKNDILPGFPLDLVPAQGSKAFRADGYSSAQQSEEIFIVGEGAHDPEYPWIPDFVREHAQFGEDGAHHDDQVDAGALAYNRLAAARRRRVTTGSTAGRSLPG
jgi:predicted phage terminase large subunit-like protein